MNVTFMHYNTIFFLELIELVGHFEIHVIITRYVPHNTKLHTNCLPQACCYYAILGELLWTSLRKLMNLEEDQPGATEKETVTIFLN